MIDLGSLSLDPRHPHSPRSEESRVSSTTSGKCLHNTLSASAEVFSPQTSPGLTRRRGCVSRGTVGVLRLAGAYKSRSLGASSSEASGCEGGGACIYEGQPRSSICLDLPSKQSKP